MRAYSKDLRVRIVTAVAEGQNKAEVARRFKVDRKTVHHYLARAKAGELEPRKAPGGPRKLSPEQTEALRQQLETYQDDTLMEHAERFAAEHGVVLAFSTVNLYCQRLGITRKKRVSTRKNETNTHANSG